MRMTVEDIHFTVMTADPDFETVCDSLAEARTYLLEAFIAHTDREILPATI
jgi:hypothetical protein